MNLKESEEMIYTACTHYDMEMQNGKLGSDRVYEGSYEQAFDTVTDELEKREKVIDEMAQCLCNSAYSNKEDIKKEFYRRVGDENN